MGASGTVHAVEPPVSSSQAAQLEATPSSGYRLLVAEDDRALREMLLALFRADGHEVVVVTNGPDLLDTLEALRRGDEGTRKFDLAVADIRMPGMTGLRAFSKLGRGPNIPPVVFMTAFGDDEVHEEARLMGALAVLDKPIDLDELLAFVNKVLASKGPRQTG